MTRATAILQIGRTNGTIQRAPEDASSSIEAELDAVAERRRHRGVRHLNALRARLRLAGDAVADHVARPLRRGLASLDEQGLDGGLVRRRKRRQGDLAPGLHLRPSGATRSAEAGKAAQWFDEQAIHAIYLNCGRRPLR